jgi:TP901 family phage tail tape measure protein
MPPSRKFQVTILGDAKGAKGAVRDTESALGHLSARGRIAGQGLSIIGTGLKGLREAAVGFGIAAGVGLGVAAKSVVALGIQYQDQLNNMQAVTHSTDAVMGQVAKTARALGNDLSLPATSAADAAQAMTELAKGGLTAQQAMQAAKGTLQLAAAAQIDGATAATIQVQALNAFGLAATNAGHVSDVLANAANAATGEISDFALGLAQSGAVAHQFGISLDDTVTALAELANAGIKGSDAGTSLKSGLLALAAPSKRASDALKTLGVNAYDSNHNFVGLRAISDQLATAHGKLSQQAFNSAVAIAFGSDAARVAGVLAKDGAAGFDKMSKSIGLAGGAAQVSAAKMKGVGGALQGLKSQVETVKIDVFTKAAPSLEAFIRRVSADLPKAADVGLRGLDRLFGFVAGEVPKARALLGEFGPDIRHLVGDELGKAGQVAEQVFAPALRGVGTVLHAVLDEAVDLGGSLGQVFAAGVGAAGHAASTFEVDAHGLADAVHEVGDSVGSVARGSLPVLRVGLAVVGDTAGALITTVTGATKALGPFSGALLAAAAAVKVAQLSMSGWGAAGTAITRLTGAYNAFATGAAIKVGVGVERASVAIGSSLPAAAARGTAAMSAVSAAFSVAVPVVGIAAAAFLAHSYTAQKNAEALQSATDAARAYQDATRLGGQAALDAQAKLAGMNATLDALRSGGGLAAKAADQLAEATRSGIRASDEAYRSLSTQDFAAQKVTAAQNNLTLAISKYGVGSTTAQVAANTLNSALSYQKALQDGVAAATETTTERLTRLTEQVATAAGAANALNISEVGVKQNELALSGARQALTDATARYGARSKEAQAAGLNLKAAEAALEGQALATAARARDLAVATDRSGNAARSAAAGGSAYRSELIKLRDVAAPGSALRKYLAGLIAALDAAARPRTAVFRFQTVGQPPPSVRGGGPAVASVYSHGGDVTGGVPGKDSVSALLTPGERVLTVAQNRDYKRMLGRRPGGGGGGSSAGGGGGNTYITLNVAVAAGANMREAGRQIAEQLAAYVAGGGTVKVAR